jgi:hypothetical protein
MSSQITVAFVQQFKSNILILSQQKVSKLRGTVRSDTITGKASYFERLGPTSMVLRTTRHGDTPQIDSLHTRRRVTVAPYEWADLIDNADKVRMLIEPQNEYAQSAAMACGRTMDDLIVAALNGNAYSMDEDDVASTVALPSGQKVGKDIGTADSNLNMTKLLTAKEVLDLADVDPDDRYIIVSPKMMTAMLALDQLTSADYNSVKALVRGEIDTFLGFKWITSTRTQANTAATGRYANVWAKRGMGLAIGEDVITRIGERADKAYSTQVFVRMDLGATRVEDECVVQIDCIGA